MTMIWANTEPQRGSRRLQIKDSKWEQADATFPTQSDSIVNVSSVKGGFRWPQASSCEIHK